MNFAFGGEAPPYESDNAFSQLPRSVESLYRYAFPLFATNDRERLRAELFSLGDAILLR
jgi:hypothetical protein